MGDKIWTHGYVALARPTTTQYYNITQVTLPGSANLDDDIGQDLAQDIGQDHGQGLGQDLGQASHSQVVFKRRTCYLGC